MSASLQVKNFDDYITLKIYKMCTIQAWLEMDCLDGIKIDLEQLVGTFNHGSQNTKKRG